MTTLSFSRQTTHLLWCAVATLGLAACGSDDSAGSAATATSQAPSATRLVSANVGVINRGVGGATTTTPGSGTKPGNGSATPGNGSGSPGTDTVANNPPRGSTPTTTTPKPGTSTDGGGKQTTGSATLDWTPPTENSDGTMLTNLAGYTVYYGTSPNSLTRSVKISNPGLTAYTVTELASGTWYFAVSAYSAAGVESTRTATVSTTI